MQAKDHFPLVSYVFFYLTAFTLPIIGLFSGQFGATAFILTALVPTMTLLQKEPGWLLPHTPLRLTLSIGLVWMLVSLFWTITPLDQSIFFWVKMCMMYLGAFGLYYFAHSCQQPVSHRLCFVLTLSVTISLLIVYSELLFNFPITHFILALKGKPLDSAITQMNRGAAILSMLIWPAFVYLWHKQKPYLAAGLLALTAATLLRMESQTSILTFFACALVLPCAYYYRKYTLLTLVIALGILTLAIPIIALCMSPDHMFKLLPEIPRSAAEYRLHIWHFAATKAIEHPFFGWGFDASRSIPVTPADFLHARHPLPIHPHNNILQVWLELGIVGLLLFFASFALMFYHAYHTENRMQMAVTTTLICSVLLIGATGYGVWQNWFIGSAILAYTYVLLVFRR